MGRIGMPELILILAIFILLFGAQKLPEIGASIGKAIRAFKKNVNDAQEDVKKSVEDKS